VGGVSAVMSDFCNIGFVMRTRAYSTSRNGTRTKWMSSYARGNETSCSPLGDEVGHTNFWQGIHQVRPAKEQVCAAIVFASNHTKVLRGPVCFSF
jgi:hypothetical protein